MRIGLMIGLWLTTISSAHATVDLSNVDLTNFKFFKYPQFEHSARLRNHGNYQSPIDYHLQRARAIFSYAGNVLFGNPQQDQVFRYEFDPESGVKWRNEFHRHFGYRGHNLIELLGSGRSKSELKFYGAV